MIVAQIITVQLWSVYFIELARLGMCCSKIPAQSCADIFVLGNIFLDIATWFIYAIRELSHDRHAVCQYYVRHMVKHAQNEPWCKM